MSAWQTRTLATSNRCEPVLAAALMLAIAGCATTAAPTRGEVVGRPAPDFTAGRLDGGQVRLSSLRGKVVVLDVWAAWCTGCEKDLPILDGIAERLAPLGVTVLAVSLDTETTRLLPIARQQPWRLTMLHDPSGRVGELYEPTSMPAVFLIDRAGIIRLARMGAKANDLTELEAHVRALANR